MPRRRKDSLSCSDLKGGRREKPVQRNAANARERTRMRVLARAFSRLKTTLPWVPADTKLSKLDTLRLAASYIAHLKGVLRDETPLHSHRQLSWPFSSLHSRGLASDPLQVPPTQGTTPSSNPFPPYDVTLLPTPQRPHLAYAIDNSYSCGVDDLHGCYDYYPPPHHDMGAS